MNAVATLERFQEIDRFNSYAQANAAEMAKSLVNVQGLEDIVALANGLQFEFSLDDVKEYIREKSRDSLTEEQLAMIAGGACTWTYTFSWTVVWTLAYAVIQAAAAAEVAVVIVLVAV